MVQSPSHLTYCTPIKYNLYFDTITSEPALHKLDMFRVPNLTSVFHSFGRSVFCNKYKLTRRLVRISDFSNKSFCSLNNCTVVLAKLFQLVVPCVVHIIEMLN
jgi:hypothetical protein